MKTDWKIDLTCVILRITLAVIFVSHGYLKLAIFGGPKWAPNLHPVVANLVAWGEIVGGLALAVGLLSRVAALGLGIIQVGAILLVRWRGDFISELVPPEARNLGMTFDRVGFEYNFALVAMCICLILLGSGALSLDRLFSTALSSSKERTSGGPAAAPAEQVRTAR